MDPCCSRRGRRQQPQAACPNSVLGLRVGLQGGSAVLRGQQLAASRAHPSNIWAGHPGRGPSRAGLTGGGLLQQEGPPCAQAGVLWQPICTPVLLLWAQVHAESIP